MAWLLALRGNYSKKGTALKVGHFTIPPSASLKQWRPRSRHCFYEARIGESHWQLVPWAPENMLFARRYKSREPRGSGDQVFAGAHSLRVRRDVAIGQHDLLECAALIKERASRIAAFDRGCNDQIGIA